MFVCAGVRLLVGHEDDNVNMIYLEGTGSGGLEELVDRLMDSKMQYALGELTILTKHKPGLGKVGGEFFPDSQRDQGMPVIMYKQAISWYGCVDQLKILSLN